MGSPLYGDFLERCAAGDDQGRTLALLATRPADENLVAAAIVLRLLGGVHRLALSGRGPELARHYPSCGGDGDVGAAWRAFVEIVREREREVLAGLDVPVQTNEVGRAAALLGGFLFVAERSGLPLRTLELGASAALLSRWDRMYYASPTWSWGPVSSAVRLTDHLVSALPFRSDIDVVIEERRACDRAPIDPTSDEGRLHLLSFVWPDQPARFERLEAALQLAATFPVTLERADAAPWLAEQLGDARPGVATVVFAAVLRQYLDRDEGAALEQTLAAAGARATLDAPLAFLTLEPQPPGVATVRLWWWPGGEECGLAHASLHGRDVVWSDRR